MLLLTGKAGAAGHPTIARVLSSLLVILPVLINIDIADGESKV